MSESDSPEAPDSIARFAADLRALRASAGSPTLTRLSNEIGISRSVITDAFRGVKLPSARTVEGVVRTCEGDVDHWLSRREALLAERSPGDDAPAPRVMIARRSAVVLAATTFILGSTMTAGIGALVGATLPPTPLVVTGEDPGVTPCVDDAAVATSDAREEGALLEILWSDKCQAGWGRLTRYDGLGGGNTLTVAIYPETAPTGPSRQEAVEHDVQSAYTNLIVRPTPDTLLCVEGSFTVDGDVVEVGVPLCT